MGNCRYVDNLVEIENKMAYQLQLNLLSFIGFKKKNNNIFDTAMYVFTYTKSRNVDYICKL